MHNQGSQGGDAATWGPDQRKGLAKLTGVPSTVEILTDVTPASEHHLSRDREYLDGSYRNIGFKRQCKRNPVRQRSGRRRQNRPRVQTLL